ncbi:hypothetical protein KBX31_07555 [Liquorilactobacillus satsumensis]|uniref:hypothetical protein n=1 Tax=Liquorilactobacillus satsumensis TaxID=259059 RepID=UPI0021C42AFE|nr:hypothetical protein [Liquorilactobacillus satsumensis]MCP9313140.1 hypothetical protein [Liquorilactobacillus satsumensis]MCP9359324.1 hypothetical protein [Liquorilactobacillus satsumensis]
MDNYELIANIQSFALFTDANHRQILKKNTLTQEQIEYRLKPMDFITFLNEIDLYNNSHQNTAKFMEALEKHYLNIGNRIVR